MANANLPAEVIRARLAGGRRLPWRDVMEMALYEQEIGYYRRGARTIGRSGDFFTSVSVGPVFGEMLALFCMQLLEAANESGAFSIVEQGAHDGRLAADILRGLWKHEPLWAGNIRYTIVEPDEGLREIQRANLKEWGDQVSHMTDLRTPAGWEGSGVFLCNELPDAFPVHRVVFDAAAGRWQEQFVEERDGELVFTAGDAVGDELKAELECLPKEAPDGCVTEINLEMLRWLRQVAELPFRGPVLVLDYGYTMDEWLASGNTKGTLCRYRKHQSDDRVLENLGECDLTSHVNFTRLAREAEALGMPVLEFIEQGRFFSKVAAPLLGKMSEPPDAAWLRQFQTLTHPGMMGRSFHALVMGKGVEIQHCKGFENQTAARRRLGLQACSI